MRALLAGARRKEPALLDLTRQLVQAESPSDDKAAVDACVALVAASRQAIGRPGQAPPPARIRQRARGAFGPKCERSAQRVLLLGHLDTVWPLGTLKTMPCRLSDGPLLGPGTLDMKAGVAMALTALEMLDETDHDLRQGDHPAAQQRRGGGQPGFAAYH